MESPEKTAKLLEGSVALTDHGDQMAEQTVAPLLEQITATLITEFSINFF